MPANKTEAMNRARAALGEIKIALLSIGPSNSCITDPSGQALVRAIYQASDRLDSLSGDLDELAELLGLA